MLIVGAVAQRLQVASQKVFPWSRARAVVKLVRLVYARRRAASEKVRWERNTVSTAVPDNMRSGRNVVDVAVRM